MIFPDKDNSVSIFRDSLKLSIIICLQCIQSMSIDNNNNNYNKLETILILIIFDGSQ